MGIVSGGGGGTTTAQVAASGSVLPTAGVLGGAWTVDKTTWNNPISGVGKLTVLVAPTSHDAVLGVAEAGDVWPRWLMSSSPTDGFYMSDGTFDPYVSGPEMGYATSGAEKTAALFPYTPAFSSRSAARMDQITPRFTITAGALPTVALVSATGAQISTTRDAETITPFTGDGTNNAATCAIALSPDNVTYSTVATISIAAALNLTGVLTDTVNARVPAGWYLKLTAVHGTIGTTTYY